VQIYGRSFPDGGHKVRLSPGGARWPAWGPAGELFYWVTGEGLMQVAHTRQSGEMLSVSRVESMWPADGADRPGPKRMYVSVAGARFDVHPSGARVLTLESVTAPAPPALLRPVIALDWTAASSPR
jgi:hypothetical protein